MLLLREMEEDGSTPDVAAFNDALDTLEGAGQWEQASTCGVSHLPEKKIAFVFIGFAGSYRNRRESYRTPGCSRQLVGQRSYWGA